MAVEIRLPDVRASAHVYFLHSEAATPTGPTDVVWICLRASSSPRLTSHCRRVLRDLSSRAPCACPPRPGERIANKDTHVGRTRNTNTLTRLWISARHATGCAAGSRLWAGDLGVVGDARYTRLKNAPKEYRGVPRQTHLGLGRTTAGVSDGRYYIYICREREKKEKKPSRVI